ncbi:MAG: ABC transporter permease [Rufibacter sp.]
MITQLRIELRKILPYPTFWVILVLQLILLYLFFYVRGHATINGQTPGAGLYQFPQVWQHLAYVSSYLNLIPGILVLILVTDEYSFRTLRQQVIDGYSRANLVQSKFGVAVLLALFLTGALLVMGLAFGLVYGSAEGEHSMFTNARFVLYYFMQLLGYLTLAMLVGFLVKKTGLAILAYLAYALIAERLLRWQMPDHLDQYLPMRTFDAFTPNPNQALEQLVLGVTETLTPPQAFVPALLYLALFCGLSYLLLRSRDL